MATATSLTQERITELMAGWEGVSVDQEAQAALIAALQVALAGHESNLEEWNNITLPQLEADLAAGSIAVSEVVDDLLPALQVELDGHDENLVQLNTIDIPNLHAQINSNWGWIDELNTVTLPALEAQLTANTDAITTLNDTTLPALDSRLDALGAGGGFDPTELEASIAALEGKFPIGTVDIQDGAITADKVEADSITAVHLAAHTITALEIAADTITANEIASHTITALEIFANTITANEIAADTITANEIAADAITAEEIAAHTITALEIAADTITANEIAADSITAEEIAAHTITALEIAADTITANEMAADSITTNELAAGAVTAENIFAGAVTTDALFAGAVTAEKVSSEIIIANELYSREGYFGTIEADQINSGAMTAEIGVLGLLSVGQIIIDPLTGIVIPSPLGDTILSATGENSRFAGAVDTDEVNINGGLTINAANNAINGSLSLTNVVVPPAQPPSVTRNWLYTKPVGADIYDLCESTDGLSWVCQHWNTKTVKKYNKITGALEATYEPWGSNFQCWAVTKLGTKYYMVMGKADTADWWLCSMSASGGSFTQLVRIASTTTVPSKMGIGVDLIGNNIMVAWANSSGNGTVRTYNTSGTQLSNETYTITGHGDSTSWCFGVGRGNWGKNGPLDCIYLNLSYSIRFYRRDTKVYDWWPGYPESLKGQCIDNAGDFRFVGFNTYRVYKFNTASNWPETPVEVDYAWYDSDSGGSGKHETTTGPAYTTTEAPWRWSWLTVQTAAPSDTGDADSPDSVAVYFDNKRQPDIGVGVTRYDFATYPTAGAASKLTNEFVAAAANPGSLVSGATFVDGVTPRLKMKGDGTGWWGDLVVDGNGKATIGGDTGWIAVTSFVDQWENYGTVYAPCAYRKIGSRVFLRGLVRGPGGLGGNIFQLPVGYRVPYNQIHAAVVSQVSASFDATGENSPTFTTGKTSNHSHDVNIPPLDVKTVVTFTNNASRLDIKTDGYVAHAGGADSTGGTNWISLDGVSFLVD